MSDDDRLIDLIYRTIAEPDLWEEVGAALRGAVGASDSLIFVSTPDCRARTLQDSLMGEDGLGRYHAHYHRHDLWMHGAVASGQFRPGNVLLDDQLVRRETFLRSAFFNDYMRRYGADRMCGIVLEANPRAARAAVVSLYRPPGAEGFAPDAVRRLAPLGEHLARALRLGRGLEAGPPPWQQALLDALPWAVFLLDHGGRVRLINARGEALASAGDGLALQQDRLLAPDYPPLEAAIAAVFARAARPVRTGRLARDLAVPRPSGRRPWLVTLLPLAGRAGEAGGIGLRLAVIVADPERRPDAAAGRLRAVFGLSPAEARVALRLLQDEPIPGIARAAGVSELTVRTQVRSLLRKTNTDRQVRLVRRLQQALDLPGEGGDDAD
ncbi:MAG: PAS domain-containing protein [Geminicoccaceae bacterium]